MIAEELLDGYFPEGKNIVDVWFWAENEYHRARNQELVNLQEESLIRQDVQQKNKFKLKEGI